LAPAAPSPRVSALKTQVTSDHTDAEIISGWHETISRCDEVISSQHENIASWHEMICWQGRGTCGWHEIICSWQEGRSRWHEMNRGETLQRTGRASRSS
jgi:hypothetical protein